jgi:hypothetical protein
MAPGVALSAGKFCFFAGEAFSLDRRGWKVAPTENKSSPLESLFGWRGDDRAIALNTGLHAS